MVARTAGADSPGSSPAGPTNAIDVAAQIERAESERNAGALDRAIDRLSDAVRAAPPGPLRARALAELGATLLAAHRYDDAGAALEEAELAAKTAGNASLAAQVRLDRASLALINRHTSEAAAGFESVAADPAASPEMRIAARLNGVRTLAPRDRLATLARIADAITPLGATVGAARARLNLADSAARLGSEGRALAYANFEDARRIADALPEMATDAATDSRAGSAEAARLAVESRDGLSSLYEASQRDTWALDETEAALVRAASLPAATSADLMIGLEWRRARLIERHGGRADAIVAYRRAVEHIESVRQDIPIDYQDGRSSYAETIEPVYLGLVNLLLLDASADSGVRAADDLARARDTLESLRQAEMQDYLGDRCTVEALEGGTTKPNRGTAFLYPVILPDRLELLLQTGSGISHVVTAVGAAQVTRETRRLTEALRSDGPDYQKSAQALYDWILRPFDAQLSKEGIETIVVVSDGPLRLVPFGALYDGQHYAVEKYAIATVTGLSMTNAAPAPRTRLRALVAGMSQAGPVADRLAADQALWSSDARGNAISSSTAGDAGAAGAGDGAGSHGPTRALPTLLLASTGANDAAAGPARREALALPGVKEEVQQLTATLKADSLLNDQFTVKRFDDEAGSGAYRIVHIASHGYFGGSARDSFILAYDDVVSLENLQGLLKSDRYRREPIELLSLSACDTAEGNDRSPLGMAGAAMKARAKSVLATLWPVEDDAARELMEDFYQSLGHDQLTKAAALRHAQLALIHDPRSAHPFFWAPFVLVGNWL